MAVGVVGTSNVGVNRRRPRRAGEPRSRSGPGSTGSASTTGASLVDGSDVGTANRQGAGRPRTRSARRCCRFRDACGSRRRRARSAPDGLAGRRRSRRRAGILGARVDRTRSWRAVASRLGHRAIRLCAAPLAGRAACHAATTRARSGTLGGWGTPLSTRSSVRRREPRRAEHPSDGLDDQRSMARRWPAPWPARRRPRPRPSPRRRPRRS